MYYLFFIIFLMQSLGGCLSETERYLSNALEHRIMNGYLNGPNPQAVSTFHSKKGTPI